MFYRLVQHNHRHLSLVLVNGEGAHAESELETMLKHFFQRNSNLDMSASTISFQLRRLLVCDWVTTILRN